MNNIKYLKTDTGSLYKSSTSDDIFTELLWGDRIEILSVNPVNGRLEANARGFKRGYVGESEICDISLLELYIIDVGQGDGILIVTPDRKHIVIDGGYPRDSQPHGKSAADFIDWKFEKDYGSDTIKIDSMIVSHCDIDHYGGSWDLVNPDKKGELNCKTVEIDKFYHAGVSWWKADNHDRFLGDASNGYLTDILGDKASVIKGLDQSTSLQLQGYWADFIRCILTSGAKISRLSSNPGSGFPYLPGYGPNCKPEIRIMGPVEYIINGQPALKDFGSEPKNTNGNSVLLRVDYDHARILLTGDLNKKSQQHLLDVLGINKTELEADVLKACHHGSDDCSYNFISAIKPSASIISSGDDEAHGHPRPNIVAALGMCGNVLIQNDEVVTPLVFSTEISRSFRIGDPDMVKFENYTYGDEEIDIVLVDEEKTEISYKRAVPPLKPKHLKKMMNRLKIVDGIVYGLVNVRTDGNKILCATLNEGDSTWDIKKFNARF